MSSLTDLEQKTYYDYFQQNHDRVFNFIQKYTDDLVRTQELTVQVFLKIWQNFSSIPNTAALDKRIYEISRDLIIKEYRHKFENRQGGFLLTEATKKLR